MKSPIKMYTLKPVVLHNFNVELPNCMYKLQNIHIAKVDGSQEHVAVPAKKVDIFEKNSQQIPEMAELEAKQTDILAQLAELKKQIFSLKKDLNIQKDTVHCPSRPAVDKTCLPDTIVLNASPSAPPYSLELVQRLLQSQIGVVVQSYVHSSIDSLPDEASTLISTLESFKPSPTVPQVNVKLIWKKIASNAEFLLLQTPIQGEVNLLRYLSRVASTTLSYDSLEVDSVLDQCHLLSRSRTKTERAGIFQILNKSLNKGLFLAGQSQMGIADIAAFSAVKQSGSVAELNAGLSKWFQKVSS